MKNFYLLILGIFLCQACVERQAPPPPAATSYSTAPARAAAPVAAAPAGGRSGEFVFIRNPVNSLMENIGLTKDQAQRFVDTRQLYVERMAEIPIVNGRRNKDLVLPILTKMNAELKGQVGEVKFSMYRKWNVWNTQQIIKNAR